MLSIDDALDNFREYKKHIEADKKGLSADADKKKVDDKLNEIISTLGALVDTQKELRKTLSKMRTIKKDVDDFNKKQESMTNDAKALSALAGKIKAASDTKGKDFDAIKTDANLVAQVNHLEMM